MNKGDYLTYKRAASISLLGLVLQAGLALALVLYGRYAADHAAVSASIYVGVGVPIWLTLLVLFDQSRRERIEAMEAESLEASGAAASSAFELAGDEARPAARRLANIEKYFVPAMSIVVGGLLVGLGLLRLGDGRVLAQIDNFQRPAHSGWAIAIGLGCAFVGFVFARFVSGMGKQVAWSPLRAGASAMVGSALAGLLLAAAHFADMATTSDWPLRYLHPALPILMVVLGIEVFVNFLLNLYRPRRKGEKLRPAFESRLLGLLAAPDKIAESVGDALNYQFGVDVTSSWFYQLLSRSLLLLLVLAAGLGWLLSMLVVIQPHQRGLLLTNGRVSAPLFSLGERGERDLGPGLHVKWPWPISTVQIPEFTVEQDGRAITMRTTAGVRVLDLGSQRPPADTPVIWGGDHTEQELLHIVQPSSSSRGGASDDGGASEFSLLAVEVPLHYVVTDVELFERLAAPGQGERILESIGKRIVTSVLASMREDEVLSGMRTDLPGVLREAIVEEYAKLNNNAGPGIEILFVGANGVHPPKDVAGNFEKVVSGLQHRESKIETARASKIESLAGVVGRVDLAEQISAKLDQLDEMTRTGADVVEITTLELEVQNLLEQAGGEAGERLLLASAERWDKHMSERGRASLFGGQSAAYRAAPALYRAKQYLAALSDVMSGQRVFLLPADMESTHLRIEMQDRTTTRGVFDTELGAE